MAYLAINILGLLSILFYGVSTNACAQLLTNRLPEILERPAKYNIPTNQTDLSPAQDVMPLLPWAVYSDREDNFTTVNPASTIRKTRLTFLQRCWVIEEQGDYLRLATGEENRVLKLSPRAKDIGWIHKSKLLLWDRCLAIDTNRRYRKVLTINTVRYFPQNKEDAENIRFTASPYKKGTLTGHQTGLQQIFFVYKETEHSLLLGISPRLKDNPERIHEVIFGWVQNTRIMPWDQRKFLEPDWDKNAVLERKTGRDAKLFTTSRVAQSYEKNDLVDSLSVLWKDDHLGKRTDGSWMRFPVIDIDRQKTRIKSEIIHVGLIKEIIRRNNTKDLKYIRAFTTLHVDDQKYPLFKYVLLMSRDELSDLIKSIEKLADTRAETNIREALHREWLTLTQAHLPVTGQASIIRMPLAIITEHVMGLPPQHNLLDGILLEDILNAERFHLDRLTQYYSSLQKSRTLLNHIFQADSYPYSFRSNNIPYYWIAQDLLP